MAPTSAPYQQLQYQEGSGRVCPKSTSSTGAKNTTPSKGVFVPYTLRWRPSGGARSSRRSDISRISLDAAKKKSAEGLQLPAVRDAAQHI